MPRQDRLERNDKPGLAQRAVKVGAVMCLASILFGLLVMVKGVLFGGPEEEDIPPIFAVMGASSCGLFTLGALVALVGWFVGATSEK